MENTIQEIRSFNHQYDKAILSLDIVWPENLSSTEVRILLELSAREGQTAKQLINQIGLDAGYLSRILTSFEKKKWLSRQVSPRDKRATLLSLTARGRTLAESLDHTVHAQMTKLLAPLSPMQRDELAQSMRRIRRLLSGESAQSPLVIRQLKLGDAGWIIHRHGALIAIEQGWDQKFEALCAQILADFIRDYDPSSDRSWIAERDGQILGSLFLVRQDAHTARLRLLYVEAAARGMGLATRLLERAIRFARERGYKTLQLFTTAENEAARRLYVRLGFVRISEEPTSLFGENLTGEVWQLPL